MNSIQNSGSGNFSAGWCKSDHSLYTRIWFNTFSFSGNYAQRAKVVRGADVKDLVVALGLEKPILAGFDWGGNASCVAAGSAAGFCRCSAEGAWVDIISNAEDLIKQLYHGQA